MSRQRLVGLVMVFVPFGKGIQSCLWKQLTTLAALPARHRSRGNTRTIQTTHEHSDVNEESAKHGKNRQRRTRKKKEQYFVSAVLVVNRISNRLVSANGLPAKYIGTVLGRLYANHDFLLPPSAAGQP